jgi:prepilin-type N-terminal cleavage/methylation domain-containing protein/prepilin-type processing-associated H-X9-DG protein
MSTRNAASRGFTLTEMLVVIAIIGVLAAMIVPAVQFARERSRQASCSNNLRQIGVAFTLHATSQQHFPNGGGFQLEADGTPAAPAMEPWDLTNRYPSPHSNVWAWGWAYQILPYMEQTQSFDSRRLDPSVADDLVRMRQAVALINPGYYCPTRRAAEAYDGVFCGLGPNPIPRGGLDYAGNGGRLSTLYPNPFPHSDANNPSGVVVPSTKLSSFITDLPAPGNIADGQTYTILAGERRYNTGAEGSELTHRGEDNGYVAGFTWDTIRFGYGPPTRDLDYVDPPPDDPLFGSSHGGSCIFVFADGSVHAIAYEVDQVVFQDMCGRSDNRSPDPGGL